MKYTCWTLFVVLALSSNVHGQTRLKGTLTNSHGAGLPFATVSVGSGAFSVNTDLKGRFDLGRVQAGALRLRASFIGHSSLDTLIQLSEGENLVTLRLTEQARSLGEMEVRALRAGDRAPFARSVLRKEEIERMNVGLDLPYLLEQQPNVVSTSDGGTGIGYTYMRIRGTDGTRTNITLNGVPFNDAESQGAFFVNLPDMASSIEDVEIQRGVGTSTNGPAAFGASVNLRTKAVRPEPWGQAAASGGSFHTQRFSVGAATGLLQDRFSLDLRLSSITSDGYIDRARADLRSYFLQGAWLGKNRSLRAIIFGGKENTYQAWAGVPREVIDTNRTFNPYTYENEVDNYGQTHYQLLFEQQLRNGAAFNVTLFRVDGAGYFEQFREADALTTYGIAPAVINGDTTITTDLVRRRWLVNTLTGANANTVITLGGHRVVLGSSYSTYQGDHFGELIWARYAGAVNIGDRYYDNDARKTDANAFTKVSYAVSDRVEVFGDAQIRAVAHTFLGYSDDLARLDRTVRFTFFNPKAGVLWRMPTGGKAYASLAVANREPNREDLVESTPAQQPRAERLTDLELGFEQRRARWASGVNLYHMAYQDQLVPTGELNDVGAALRTNVPESYRTGVELSGAWQATTRLLCKGNLALSRNRIRAFTEYVDDWDSGGQQVFALGERDLAFSPQAVGGGEVSYRALQGKNATLDLALISKYVGAQYLDNTSGSDRRLGAFMVHDLRMNASLIGIKDIRAVELHITVRNLMNEQYESNGWAYSYFSEGRRQALVGLFPQAPIHVLGGLSVLL
jgi:iron complex outermembrane recepter protein